MKRPTSAAPVTKGSWHCPDKAFLSDYPSLAQGMCDPFWEDGKKRGLWGISFRFEDGMCHLTVNDKDAGAGLYTTMEDLPSALAAVEELISQDVASWRKWRK